MREDVRIASVAVALMLVSLVYSQHIFQIDYEAYNYGFPLAWLIHYVEGVVPVNVWYPNGFGFVLDLAFWLVVSIVLVSGISLLRLRSKSNIPRK
jgi:hypothetical protein